MSDRQLIWTAEGWEDYLYWQTQDRKTLKRINTLIEDVLRDDPFEGIGKPEPLKHALAGAWSRRIDEANRLIYIADDRALTILQARYHY
ncbi:Txe/YoeB family addiction module toxin [Arthrobacter sp. MYb224]|uniref:Txe/YoeB family addiction module toxin n=1 Tax=Micrococcaceae TaxID=1268 RepID=UPI000BB97A2A|nr:MULTISPECIES: Txe/YoeB family addiction module toxin [Micrococcaceae]PCC28871.1 Txe/YoeB family addiction module toxin [Glutamicibacter sp. BW80]PQZ98762.1 Txe/YoeB family addiction module toxin [Arthrobacter sp. MYb224]PRA03095.1 Txe/YoeB family addiction module toxin [Arthrobacter sp. MYb229]PRB49566.1 Txe/YoeB family addiction module toxin [Arthrobacter sp. MYb216]